MNWSCFYIVVYVLLFECLIVFCGLMGFEIFFDCGYEFVLIVGFLVGIILFVKVFCDLREE